MKFARRSGIISCDILIIEPRYVIVIEVFYHWTSILSQKSVQQIIYY